MQTHFPPVCAVLLGNPGPSPGSGMALDQCLLTVRNCQSALWTGRSQLRFWCHGSCPDTVRVEILRVDRLMPLLL